MRRPSKLTGRLLPVLTAAWLAGCQVQAEPADSARRPGARMDPCADRLHGLCGQLLLYHAGTRRLPRSLADLPPPATGAAAPAVCPASGLPYVYDPRGLHVAGQAGLLVLYDAAPSHAGMRWGIFVDPPGNPRLFTARVVLLDEPTFQAAADTARPSPERQRQQGNRTSDNTRSP